MEASISGALGQIETRNPECVEAAIKMLEILILEGDRAQFAATQDSFVLNIAGRIALQLDFLLGSGYPQTISIALLRLLRGVCLLHKPSRGIFNNDHYLEIILQNGIKSHSPEIQEACVDVLVSILVRQVETIRRFEALKGLKVVCDVFKQSKTSKSVKLTILQFLFFYLVPETRFPDSQWAVPRKTTKDKQQLLGKYLSNVDGLVHELEVNQPFGHTEIEW